MKSIKIAGIMRVRNESLILKDSLDHISKFVDAIIVFDDKSDDDSVQIALDHPSVIEVICNKKWRVNRTWEETANRAVLLQEARQYKPKWIFYMDADERFEGNIRSYLENCDSSVLGVRISLFDSYITNDDKDPYVGNKPLFGFRRNFGPEKRDILMIWKNTRSVQYILPDSREPTGIDNERVITNFFCQHFGKSLSIDHWEKTCDYYIKNFPQYSEKWKNRKGKAIHIKSDFSHRLYSWETVKKVGFKL